MARGQHAREIPPQGNSSNVKLAAGLLSDNVPTSFSNMEWCFQENKDYASMHRKQSQKMGWDKRASEGDQDNSKSESRSEEDAGGQRSSNRNAEQSHERKRRGFAIQIKNNDPIIFDDDSVSTLTHYDRRSPRKESGDLSDMLGPFQQHGSTGRMLAPQVVANRIQEGEALIYNAPSDSQPIDQNPIEQKTEAKTSNFTLSRQQKLNRAKNRLHGKAKEIPSLLSINSSASTSFRSARSVFEKQDIKETTPAANMPIKPKTKVFLAAQAIAHSGQSTPVPAKPSMGIEASESNGVVSKRPSCLKTGTSERSARSIVSCLKNEKSEKSARSVTFCDEDTELGSHKDSPAYDIPAAESNLSASECKKSLSLKYKKSHVSREGKTLKHLNEKGHRRTSNGSIFGMEVPTGCPFEFNFDFDFDCNDFDINNFDFRKFDIRKFDISMLSSAFDFVGRNKCYNLTPSYDEDEDEDEVEVETVEETEEEIMARQIAAELVEFPQPRWSKGMAASE